MRTLIGMIVIALMLPATASAQTPQLVWTAPNNSASVAQAQALEYRLYVNDGTPTMLTGVSCTGTAPAAIECSTAVPAGVPTAIDTRLELTAKSATSAESARSAPFIRPPSAPTSLRFQ